MKNTKKGTIAITYAPSFVKRLRAEEMKDKEDSFLMLYQQSEGDSTGDKIYKVGLYKIVGYAPLRTDEGLEEVLEFVKQHENAQILNLDEINEEGEK